MNKEIKSVNEIRLPDCALKYGYTCADCIHCYENDRNRWGEVYCSAWGRYEAPYSSCSRFQAKV